MAFIKTWDETKPAGTRALNLGDDDIREFKRAVRERLAGGGMYFPSTDDANAGLYNNVKFIEQSANPTVEANRGFLFTKDVSGVTELYWMDSSGNVMQLTSGGAFLITNLSVSGQARGDLIVRGASAWQRLAIGASGRFLRSDGTDPSWSLIQAGDVSYTNLPAGMVVNVAHTSTGAVATGTTAMPFDDTIPQNTEGDQYLTLAITPKATAHKLLIEVIAYYAFAGADYIVGGIFQDSTADALAAGVGSYPLTSETGIIVIRHYMTAGTTSATTFKFRLGSNAGGTTLTLNGLTGARKLGGVFATSMKITEVIA